MPTQKDLKDISVSSLSGVGRVKSQAYMRLGIESLADLIEYYPRAYEDRGNISLLCETRSDIKSAVILTVATSPKVSLIRRGMSILKFRAFDESGSCEIVYFNQDYLRDKFTVGSVFRFWGKVENERGKYSMSSPISEPYTESKPLPPYIPIYKLTDGLSQKQISENVAGALCIAQDAISDPLPQYIISKYDLCDLHEALRSIHMPQDTASLARAKRRLIFDELFTFALGMSVSEQKISNAGSAPAFRDTDISEFLSKLPYKLTGAQRRAIDDIINDMKGTSPMSRILIGDVGSGKTVCAAAAAYVCAKNGYQASIMAPTEILATQHYNDLSSLLGSLNIKCALLTGSLSEAKKAHIHSLIASDDQSKRIDVVIGTQALISEKVEFARPGLNIADEQHRFGVNQRATLRKKAHHTHTLVMSATPIPRSLSLVMYGSLSLSRIDEMPPGRQRVDTFLVDSSYRKRLDAFIEKQVKAGHQVYIVCPAVEDSELCDDEIDLSCISDDGYAISKKPPLKAAVSYAAELSERLSDIRVSFVHGKMKAKDKDAVMQDFTNGLIDVLVSTTVIEVGVNVPNATLMIVENAERFGLSQLHQLRGRVGRGAERSYCVLVSGTDSLESLSQQSKQRLSTMCKCYDGFEIAEEDLRLRGPGDFLCMSNNTSIRQSGDVYFKLADMCGDKELMECAFSEAKDLINNGGDLSLHGDLLLKVQRMFTINRDIIS